MSDSLPEDYVGGWDAHHDDARRIRLETTPAQRLQWLEQAIAWVHAVEERRRRGELDATENRLQ